MYRSIADTIMDNMINDLRKRILPILLYCQANKGDLWLSEEWRGREDAGKKSFYAYYSGLFCRILCLLEKGRVPNHIVHDCDALLDKYNWYDIQKEDLEKCKAEGSKEKMTGKHVVDYLVSRISILRYGKASVFEKFTF